MNSGPNQHYIPRFLQRPFGIPPKRNRIWYFERATKPEQRRIKRTGSEDHFYSHPTADGRTTLDDKITDVESQLSSVLHTIRSEIVGRPVDPHDAAALVAHLASRTAHIRDSLEHGLTRLLDQTTALFNDPDKLKGFVGLDRPAPSDRFREKFFADFINRPEIAGLNVPTHVLERIAFYFAKENISDFLANGQSLLRPVLRELFSGSNQLVRDAHTKALIRSLKSNPRETFLGTLDWTIDNAPAAGAILPDCVVIALDKNGNAVPYMLIGEDDIRAVITPVSPRKLLVGRSAEYAIPEAFEYNEAAARSSYSFFLSSCNDAETVRLHLLIAERSVSILDEGVENALRELLPMRAPRTSRKGTDKPEAPFIPIRPTTTGFQYEVSLVGFENHEVTQRISTQLKNIVSILSRTLPLGRLDGVTIAGDYPAALRDLDRGFENAPSATTVGQEVGVGVAQVVTVRRSGQTKGRIVMSSGIAHALISGNAAAVELAIYIVVKELALVAMIEIVDRTLPGVLLRPIEGEFNCKLYTNADAALHEYVASRIASVFGDQEELAKAKRQLLADSINRMRDIVHKEKLAYRCHRDLNRLLAVVLPAVRQVLIFAADLLGHSSVARLPTFHPSDDLETSLEHAGLKNWLGMYKDDLERFYKRLGRWESFSEFLFFNVHVERLLWQLGMLPWEASEGIRVEITYGSDAPELFSLIRRNSPQDSNPPRIRSDSQ